MPKNNLKFLIMGGCILHSLLFYNSFVNLEHWRNSNSKTFCKVTNAYNTVGEIPTKKHFKGVCKNERYY